VEAGGRLECRVGPVGGRGADDDCRGVDQPAGERRRVSLEPGERRGGLGRGAAGVGEFAGPPRVGRGLEGVGFRLPGRDVAVEFREPGVNGDFGGGAVVRGEQSLDAGNPPGRLLRLAVLAGVALGIRAGLPGGGEPVRGLGELWRGGVRLAGSLEPGDSVGRVAAGLLEFRALLLDGPLAVGAGDALGRRGGELVGRLAGGEGAQDRRLAGVAQPHDELVRVDRLGAQEQHALAAAAAGDGEFGGEPELVRAGGSVNDGDVGARQRGTEGRGLGGRGAQECGVGRQEGGEGDGRAVE
jgi:hypothetical protein